MGFISRGLIVQEYIAVPYASSLQNLGVCNRIRMLDLEGEREECSLPHPSSNLPLSAIQWTRRSLKAGLNRSWIILSFSNIESS